MFHCSVVRAEPPRSSRDIPRRLRSVRRFGAVGSEGRRAQVDRRIGKSAPRATCRGSVEEPRASSAHFVSETPQHPSLKTAMGSSRIKNPHHTGGIIPSLCLETRFPSEFQAKKRCENATRAFAFAKRSEFPTYLPYEVVDRRRRRVLAISEGFHERFESPTVYLFFGVCFHEISGWPYIPYNTLRAPTASEGLPETLGEIAAETPGGRGGYRRRVAVKRPEVR